MKKIFAIIILFFVTTTTYAVVSNIHAVYKNGQVFVTWTNLSTTGVKYYLYKSVTPITNGTQLSFAQNLGYVVDSSGINKRLTKILSPTIPIGLRIDSAGNYLTVATGLFVATTTANGTFYYAIATKTGTVLDTSIVSGSNSLSVTDSVTETLADPQPVWQRSYTHDSVTAQFYVQFVTGITSATYPLMTNAGSFPFNFSIYKPNNLVSPLVVKLHAGDGNFIQSATNEMVTYENESRLSLDDWVPNDDVNTYWFGYHENYNIYSSSNPVHASGVVRAYTIRRVLHTIDWVTKHFNIDTSRIYLTGISMGAIGARTIAFLYPEKFAAVVMNVPKFNFYSLPELSLLTDMKNPSSGNYLTGYQARCIDYLLHEDLNLSHPFMIATNGKNDFVVGWSEKPVFYDSANVNLLGGAYYWDLKAHNGVGHNWKTNYSPNFFRFRNDCSYPAFSNCTSNGNPGNGSPADGDSVGTINGRIGWCDNITDLPSRYSIILKTMTLINQNLSGLFPALDSAVADVTLRRVQHFHPPDGTTIYWVNKKNGGQVIQHGCFVFNEGLMTVTAIRIFNESDTLIFSTATILSTDIQVSICNGSNYILPWGQMVSSAGIYSHVYSTAGSCDSLVRYFISIYPVYSIALNERVCQGSNYNLPWGGAVSVAGNYNHIYSAISGCDSIVSINLSVDPVFLVNQTETICDGSAFQLPWGSVATIAGTYSYHYSTVTSCDSLVSISVSINPQFSLFQSSSICQGDSFILPWGNVVSAAGNYSHTYSTVTGCDSVLNYEVHVHPVYTSTQNVNICSGTSYVLPSGETSDTSGVFTYNFNSVHGCDSIVQIVLSVDTLLNTFIDTTIQTHAQYDFSWGGSTDISGVFSHLFSSAEGCDSMVTVTVHVLPDGMTTQIFLSGFSFNAFPNPVKDIVTFSFSRKLDGRFFISDLSGKKIVESALNNCNSISANLNSLVNGVYFVTLYNSQQWIGTGKIIVVH